MKFVVYVALAASLFAIAAAVTLTDYTDTACKTVKATTTDQPNPFTANLNTCTKYGDRGYLKIATCATGGKVAGLSYSDAACTQLVGGGIAGDEGKCVVDGTTSSMVTCASTSSVTMAFLAVAAAVLALSF